MTRFQANTSVSQRWALLGVGLVCLAFALGVAADRRHEPLER